MKNRLVSIILPVYRQADYISSVLQEYNRALKELAANYEIILVVNGSGDNSLDVCNSLSREYSNIQVIYSAKKGWGLAVKLGLNKAGGDLLCYTNSARTSIQDLVLLLTYAFMNPNVVVKATRKIREGWQRRIGSLLYNLECRTLFDLSYWDINATPKIFPRQFDKLLRLSRDDDLIDLEFCNICRQEDYPVLEVPIFSTRHQGTKSTTNYYSAIKMYWGAYKMQFRSKKGH